MKEIIKLINKKICILGLGIENYALVKFLLAKKILSEITICDARKNVGAIHELPLHNDVKWRLGKNYDRNLVDFDIVFRSPGYSLFNSNLLKAQKAGVKISSPMKLFFALCPSKNIIGVTGTKGKGTTALLIYKILKLANKRVWIGGNIGVAQLAFINKIKKDDWVVLELSSFQLEDMTVSPHIAVITNFYKEHLFSADPNNPNYHKNLSNYRKAKLNIIKWQRKNDKAIVNKKLDNRSWKLGDSKKIYFTKFDLPSKLVGEHNKENVAAAVKVAKVIGIKDVIIKKAIKEFKSPEHRLELVRTIQGVKYYNDSFATTPESTIIALKSFTSPIVLLAGGAEKGSNFKRLAKEIKKRVKFTVLLAGKATPRIKKELLKIKYSQGNIKLAKSMSGAMKTVKKKVEKNDIVLLSPACASFGMFKNYKERGLLFKNEVKKQKIKNKTNHGFVP